MIDAQQAQLDASLLAVEELRASWSTPDGKCGKVTTHLPEMLGEALQSSWLVVEVRPDRI